MSVQVKDYVPDQLLFSRSPKILSYIKERRPQRVFPNGKLSGWTSNSVMDFEIRSDSLIDTQSAVLNFTVSFPSADTFISSALDFIQSIRVFYSDVQIEEILDANAFSNLFLLYSANKTYLDSEGSTYLGLDNQFVDATNSGSREYSIPLSLVLGCCRLSSYLPMMGNRLRISITLAPDAKVVSLCKNTSDTYTLNQVSLTYDEVVVSEKFKKMIMDAMSSETGLRLAFTSQQVSTLNIGAVSTWYGRLQFNLSNVLSIHMLINNDVSKARQADKWILPCESFPLTNFSKAFVRVGSTLLTPPDGIKSYLELFQNQNKTISQFNDLLGTGVIDYATLTGGYTPSASVTKANYGLCPISIPCDKIQGSDENLVNQGVSSSGVNEFNFEISKTAGNTFSQNDVALCSLVHKRAIVFQQGGINCEF